MTQAQQWLTSKYSNKQSGDSIKLLTSEELSGEILIEEYTSIKEIILVRLEKGYLSKGKITKVTISNCPAVERIILGGNEIAAIDFKGDFFNLTQLELQDNQLKAIELSKVPNLEILNIARNPINSQDLEKVIRDLTKLKFVNTPGFNLKNIADDHTGWINPNDIKNVLGINPKDPLPDDWKNKLDDLKKRPTQEDLNNAVKNAKDEFKDYINPKNPADKAKVEQAAIDAGFISPNDLESKAKEKGMVSKAEYDKVKQERDNRPNVPLADWNNDWSKRPKQSVLDEIQNKIKGLLGIPPATPLPSNWMDQLAKRSDLDAARNDLNKWTGKFPGKTPEQVDKDLKEAQSRPTAGGSGAGATLTPIQQKKIEYFGVMASYLNREEGDWKKFIDNWKIKNVSYVERTQTVIEQPLK